VHRYYASFHYQAGSLKKSRRVVAKVEWHPGELCPRGGFIVTNLAQPAGRDIAFSTTGAPDERWGGGMRLTTTADVRCAPLPGAVF
jgi:hypothetical protein